MGSIRCPPRWRSECAQRVVPGEVRAGAGHRAATPFPATHQGSADCFVACHALSCDVTGLYCRLSMWDYAPPRKPFYRRPTFAVPFWVAVVVVVIAAVAGYAEKEQWERRARDFDYRKLSEMESASGIFDRTEAVLGRIFIQNRGQVAFEDLSPALLTAVVAAEDARFNKHKGVDFIGIARAAIKNYRLGRKAQG